MSSKMIDGEEHRVATPEEWATVVVGDKVQPPWRGLGWQDKRGVTCVKNGRLWLYASAADLPGERTSAAQPMTRSHGASAYLGDLAERHAEGAFDVQRSIAMINAETDEVRAPQAQPMPAFDANDAAAFERSLEWINRDEDAAIDRERTGQPFDMQRSLNEINQEDF